MRQWREILDDKLLGGALCILLLLSFAFQVADASRAAAAMIFPDPLSIICTSSGGTENRAPGTNHTKPCPCTELRAAGLHLQAAVEPSATSGIPIRFADRVEIAVDNAAPLTALPPGHSYEAQGPPSPRAPT